MLRAFVWTACAAAVVFARPAAAQDGGGFGTAVAVAGPDVLVGEPVTPVRPGQVYVYRRGPDGWFEAARLSAPGGRAGDGFGAALDAEGDLLLVGGPGGAHVFRRTGETWRHQARLAVPADSLAEVGSVALAGDWALVGVPGAEDARGAVHLFRRSGATWAHAGELAAEGLQQRHAFGYALAAEGDWALVGAPGFRAQTGAVFAFRRAGPGWQPAGNVAPASLAAGEAFGYALDLRGGMLAVGAPGALTAQGAVYLLRAASGGAWSQVARVTAPAAQPRELFGFSVALAPGMLWVGAPAAAEMRGQVVTFPLGARGVDPAAARRIDAAQAAENDRFGAALAAGQGVAAVALAGEGDGGTVAVFGREGGDWRQAGTLSDPPAALPAVTGRRVPCAGGKAEFWDCREVDLLSFLPVAAMGGGRGIRTNDVWGWTDPQTGKEYALVGMMDRVSFVDVSDPVNPVYVGTLPKPDASPPAVWRDLKVYRDHVYVVADASGPHGIQVLDLTRLRQFAGQPITFTPDAVYDRIHSAHNIAINEESGFAYAVGSSGGGETCGGGLHMVDVRDPKRPTFAGCFSDPQTGRSGTGYTHDAQCVIYRGPDARYQGREICIGANETAVSIADVTDKRSPKALSRAPYPDVAYSHQGWLSDDHRWLYMDDELDEIAGSVQRTRTLVWDVSDLEDPRLVAQFLGETAASDHNLYVLGDRIFQSNYQAGLRVLDRSNPTELREVGYFDTVPYGTNTPGFGGSWSNYPYFRSGNVIVTSGSEGLFVVRPTGAAAPGGS